MPCFIDITLINAVMIEKYKIVRISFNQKIIAPTGYLIIFTAFYIIYHLSSTSDLSFNLHLVDIFVWSLTLYYD